ncbi:MAG: RNA polymerase sigma factor [Patescibacteria group bacterium]|jgi:RNA polymerase sigma-70 factor (ECF subfamily)
MANQLLQKFKDNQALRRLARQDKEAFAAAYDQNVADIYRFIYFKIGSEEEAHDLTSTVFLKAWNHIQTNTLEDSKTLRALFYKVARNAIIDHYRETSQLKQDSLDDETKRIEVIDEDSLGLEDQLDQQAELALIKSKLPLLKEEYREVVIMRFINDLTIEEIADISERKKGNVRVLLHRALKALRELMELEQ